MELIQNGSIRIQRLSEYLSILASGSATRENWDAYRDVLESATAFEVNAVLHASLSGTNDMNAWKVPVSRFLRAAARGLERTGFPEYPAGHPVSAAEEGTREVQAAIEKLQALSVSVRNGHIPLASLAQEIGRMTALRDHYEDLQNGLFARFEAASNDHACLKLLWALQDDVLALQRELAGSTGGPEGESAFWKKFGEFFLLAGALAWRERYVLYPVALRALPGPDAEPGSVVNPRVSFDADGAGASSFVFMSSTGSLRVDELEAIFKLLPIDVAFIGADDRVKFYSDPPHRIFPRSPAVIGRLVQNCHPPKSVATVEEILRSFRDGSRDRAEFWLEARGAFVHITYFAVRDSSGRYAGTLEVTQDATHVRSLEGEKRLL